MKVAEVIFEIVRKVDTIIWSLRTFGLKGYMNIRKLSFRLKGWR
jgi:hypothetical protein